jgi:diaminopimelate epimerase
MSKRKINFWKMSGSGNDFVVIDNRKRTITAGSGLARQICHRQEGVGADGLLLLEPSRRAAFRMVYFNSDGSRASMCGNGARCLSWAAHAWGAVGTRFNFETDAGLVKGEVDGGIVRVTLSDPKDYRSEMRVKAVGKTYRLAFINTGVPHAVVQVSNAEAVDLPRVGRALRFHRAFGPKGANVNFVQKLNRQTLRVRTYERGVEGETLACGTGVAASAIASALRGMVRTPVRCVTTGGDTLEVDFQLHPSEAHPPVTGVTLRGPVRRTFAGQVEI